MTFEAIKDRLPELDELVKQGWSPCINSLTRGGWHVGLQHKCDAENEPKWAKEIRDGEVVMVPVYGRYHIHATRDTLLEAIDEAIGLVNKLTATT